MTHINVERLLRETPLSVEPSSLDAIHQRLFGPTKRRAPEHYEIHEELGRGGFGHVYRSTDTRYPREVALKVIHYHGARQLARLEREARALAGLAHPNIVTVFDKGIADAGVYFLATERVTGKRLDVWMHDPARRLPEILEVFAQAAEGLHHAHQRGMIHRDFKPSNAIVDDEGRLRILDFGLVELVGTSEAAGTNASAEGNETVLEGETALSTAASHVRQHPTRSSAPGRDDDSGHAPGFRGTPAYASPEQLEGKAVDSRTDQFSLCVALFEACHGFRPFSGRTVLELSEQMIAGDVARSRSRRKLPRWLGRLLRRGLSPVPAERFESVGEIATILRAHLRPKPWWAVATGVGLALGLVAGIQAITKPPELALDWRGAWPEGVDAAEVGTRHGSGLRQSLEAYEHAWKDARDAYARDPDREADGTEVQCLSAAKQRFSRFVDGLGEPAADRLVPPSLFAERIWLAHVSDPAACLAAEPHWETNDVLVGRLLEAQAARLAGRYDEALERLASVHNEPALSDGRPSALFHYELGVVQLHRRDPAAWRTLAIAAQDAGGDRELLVDAMARQLEAGVVLQAAEPGEIETLLWMLRRRAEAGPVAAPLAAPLVTLAEAYALLQRGRHQEAQGAYARAREAFAALEPSPYRDVMIAHCTLGEAYAGSHSTPPDLDLDALEPALATMGARLGEGHPSYLRHAIKVARLLGDQDRLGPARRVLASAIAEVDEEGSPGFELVRARAELLRLELEGNGYAGDPKTVAEWSATAEMLGTRLDALDQGRGLTPRADVYRVREILLSVHSVAEDDDRMVRVLQQLWDDAERSSKVADTCDYSSQLLGEATDEKNEASGAILEIEARLRTRCGCEVEDRPERGRSTSSERTSSP